MARKTKAERVTEATLAALREGAVGAGFSPAPELGPSSFLTSNRVWLGQCGVDISGGVGGVVGGGDAFVGSVRPMVYSETIEELRARIAGPQRLPGTVLVELAGLEKGNLRVLDQRILNDPTRAEDFAAHTMQRLAGYAESWYRNFDSSADTYDYLLNVDNRNWWRDSITGALIALNEGNVPMAERFARQFAKVWNSEVVPEFFNNTADIFRQIDAEFGVDLPFPAWDEVSTKRN